MASWLRAHFARRPLWMNALMLFSAYMAFVYMPWDLFVKPVSQDVEVWFGVRFHGWAAKLTEPLHWAIYAAGAYGFWRMRSWMWPWAAVYVGQIAIAMLVWNVLYDDGAGWLVGLVAFGLFGLLTRALWNAADLFEGREGRMRERYGEWALITGASVGIGEAFARALAREGMSVILVARRADRLKDLAAELEKTHAVATRVIALDLVEEGAVEHLVAEVADLDVGLLVNNAGIGYAGRFDKQDPDRLRDLVELNCRVPLQLTHALVGPMVERRNGGVIIVGSVGGAQPVPYLATYSATKAFDRIFGEALWAELRDEGVDVLTLEPGPTETEFQQTAGELPHPGDDPADVVETALRALGQQPSVIHGWRNYLQAQASRLVPRSLLALLAKATMKTWTPPDLR